MAITRCQGNFVFFLFPLNFQVQAHYAKKEIARGCILLNRFSPYRVIFLSTTFPNFQNFSPSIQRNSVHSRNTFEWQQIINILRFIFSFSLFRLQKGKSFLNCSTVELTSYVSKRSTNDRRVVEELAKIL